MARPGLALQCFLAVAFCAWRCSGRAAQVNNVKTKDFLSHSDLPQLTFDTFDGFVTENATVLVLFYGESGRDASDSLSEDSIPIEAAKLNAESVPLNVRCSPCTTTYNSSGGTNPRSLTSVNFNQRPAR